MPARNSAVSIVEISVLDESAPEKMVDEVRKESFDVAHGPVRKRSHRDAGPLQRLVAADPAALGADGIRGQREADRRDGCDVDILAGLEVPAAVPGQAVGRVGFVPEVVERALLDQVEELVVRQACGGLRIGRGLGQEHFRVPALDQLPGGRLPAEFCQVLRRRRALGDARHVHLINGVAPFRRASVALDTDAERVDRA